MFGFGGNKNKGGPIGIAVSAHDVRLVQHVGGRFRFECEPLAEGTEPTGPDYHAECSRAIATAMRRGKFVGKTAVSALPAEFMRYKTLRMPPMPEPDLTQAIAWEAAERFQITEDQALQHYCAGEVQQGSEKREEVILLAAERSAVYDHARAIKDAGLKPTVIDATGAALARLLASGNQATLIVHCSEKSAEIIAVRGDRVIFDKPIELTRQGEQIDPASLSREIGLCLRYLSVTFGVHKADAAWISGLGTGYEFAANLTDALHSTVNWAGESSAVAQADCPDTDPSDWLVPLGLSLHTSTGQAHRGAA